MSQGEPLAILNEMMGGFDTEEASEIQKGLNIIINAFNCPAENGGEGGADRVLST